MRCQKGAEKFRHGIDDMTVERYADDRPEQAALRAAFDAIERGIRLGDSPAPSRLDFELREAIIKGQITFDESVQAILDDATKACK